MSALFVETKTYKPGDVLVRSQPWICAVDVSHRHSICASCFRTSTNKMQEKESHLPRTCSLCKTVSYCSEMCQKEHWKSGHGNECAFLGRLLNSPHGWKIFSDRKLISAQQSFLNTTKLMTLKIINAALLELPEQESNLNAFLELEIPSLFQSEFIGMEDYFPPQVPVLDAMKLGNDKFERKEYKQIIQNAFDLDLRQFNKLTEKCDPAVVFQKIRIYGQMISSGQWSLSGDLSGIGLYLETTKMTRTCDSNGFVGFDGKELVVRAVQTVSGLTSLKDIKIRADNSINGFKIPLSIHQAKVIRLTGKPCESHRCSKEVEAELIPLRCHNKHCFAPIPSDKRASEPCPRCRAVLPAVSITSGRANILKHYKNALAMVQPVKGDQLICRITDVKSLLDVSRRFLNDEFVHPVNTLHLLAVHMLGQFYHGQYMWGLGQVFIPMVREIYPANSLGLAQMLWAVGMRICGSDSDEMDKNETKEAIMYLQEAENICKVLFGEGYPGLDGIIQDKLIERFELNEIFKTRPIASYPKSPMMNTMLRMSLDLCRESR